MKKTTNVGKEVTQEVEKFYKKHPKAGDIELYNAFPNISKSKLRFYKTKALNSVKTTTDRTTKKESLTSKVHEFLGKHPDATNELLYKTFPSAPRTSLRVHKSTFLKSKGMVPQARSKKVLTKRGVSKKLVKSVRNSNLGRVAQLENLNSTSLENSLIHLIRIQKKISELDFLIKEFMGDMNSSVRNTDFDKIQKMLSSKILDVFSKLEIQ